MAEPQSSLAVQPAGEKTGAGFATVRCAELAGRLIGEQKLEPEHMVMGLIGAALNVGGRYGIPLSEMAVLLRTFIDCSPIVYDAIAADRRAKARAN